MTRRGFVAATLLLGLVVALATAGQSTRYDKAPEFPSQNPKEWIGPPRSMKALEGKVVILDVWTFMCINCVNTIPWIKEMEKRYGERGLVIVGVHTPEFDQEKSRTNVEAAVRERGLQAHSHFLDNHMNYWRALRNEYWPAIYVVDAQGQIRDSAFGEVHIGTNRDKELSGLVEKLLVESAAAKN
jgi:thiol-disulfide isomerase/thioredoxin